VRSILNRLAAESATFAERNISLQAAASVLPTRIALAGSTLSEITAEGYPGMRFHSGTSIVDEIERRTIESAKFLFGAEYANVQPLSCTIANIAALRALVNPGGTVLSHELSHGGHLSHGAKANISSDLFRVRHYGLTDGVLDYEAVHAIAKETRPSVIICGASSYPRKICYRRFRQIADDVGALLLADVSHVSGLIASGKIDSPIPWAHVVTTSTYKQLYGPRGGLILSSTPTTTIPHSGMQIAAALDRSVFPGIQGTPDYRQILQKGLALQAAMQETFKDRMELVLNLATELCNTIRERGLRVASGGTDTHMVLIDLRGRRESGKEIELALEQVGVLTNRNLVPNDPRPAREASGLRLGTNTAAYRNIDPETIHIIGNMICDVIFEPHADVGAHSEIVAAICSRFPLRAVESDCT